MTVYVPTGSSARWRLLLRLFFPPWAAVRSPARIEVAMMVEWQAAGALGVMPGRGRVTARHRAWARAVLADPREQAAVVLPAPVEWILCRPK